MYIKQNIKINIGSHELLYDFFVQPCLSIQLLPFKHYSCEPHNTFTTSCHQYYARMKKFQAKTHKISFSNIKGLIN